MTRYTLPTETYRVRFHAYCGMSYDIAEGETLPGARRQLARLLRRRRATGHSLTVLMPGVEYEVGEPEDCALVPDTAGTVTLQRERMPAWECWQCGDILPMGVACSCSEVSGDDDSDYDGEGE
jgi:hypothetical protein